MAKTKRVNAPLPVIVNGAYKLTVYGAMFGRPTSYSLFYIPVSVPPGALGSAADLLASWNGAAIKGLLLAAQSANYANETLVCEDLTLPAALPAEQIDATSGADANVGDPSFIAASIRRITGTRGQHGRGRFMLPGVPATVTAGDGWKAGYKATLLALTTGLLVPIPSVANPIISYRAALCKVTLAAGPPIVRTVTGQALTTARQGPFVGHVVRRRPKVTS